MKLEKVLGRSIPGFDLHDALMKSKKYLLGFGGHNMACGLSLKMDNFEKLKNNVLEIAKEKEISNFVSIINIEEILELKDVNQKLVESISFLEPFGEGNPRPIFAFKNLKINAIRSLTDGKHLKLSLKDQENNYIDAIGFNLGHFANDYKIGDKIDVAGNIEINSFNGIDSIQINLKDLMKSI